MLHHCGFDNIEGNILSRAREEGKETRVSERERERERRMLDFTL